MDLAALARELNPPQVDAVVHTEGPLLVFAGAGSGKTRVITYRIANIVENHGVASYRVMAVTFTNKAAGEMRARIGRLVGPERARDLWVATFHATGAKLLRRYPEQAGLRRDFAIYDDSDQRVVMNRVFEALKINDKVLAPRTVLGEIDRAKQEVISPDAFAARARSQQEHTIAQAYALYERKLADNNAVDFGDLLSKVAHLVESNAEVRGELQERFHYLLVDEFQDTNNAQYRLLRALVGPRRNICVVGDDDQAIYRWRGADVRNIQYFKRDFPAARVVKLEQNYRSTARILRAANAVIARSHTREDKVLFTHNPEGARIEVVPCEDERDEARQIALRIHGALRQGVPPREVAVFYRIHAQSRPLEEGLRAANIPYVIVGGVRFYERAEVKDVLSYLRLMLNPNDDVNLLRVVNTPARKIGKTTLDRVIAHAGARGTTLWKVLAAGDLPPEVAPAARKALTGFYALVAGLRKKVAGMLERPSEVAGMVYAETGYQAMLADTTDPDNEARRENLAELLGSMAAYEEETTEPSLSDYLERVSLSEAVAEGDAGERVSLMTVHSAKGLEFDQVFLAALEEGMFPYKGIDLGADPEELEEERRLGYVAITRARKHLVVSFARFRQIFGQTRVGGPSRFLTEMPEDVLTTPVRTRGAVAVAAHRAGVTGHGPHAPHVPQGSHGGYRIDRTEHNDLAHAPHHALRRPAPVQGAHGVHGAVSEDPTAAEGPTVTYDTEPMEPAGEFNTPTRFRRGMRVKHPKFGVGTVKAVEPGAEPRVVVYFPGIGQEKKLLAQFIQALY